MGELEWFLVKAGLEFVTRRKQFKKSKLRWRVSRGARKSLGWIPFKENAVLYKNGQVHFAGKALSLWDMLIEPPEGV